jgi:hypothetical protein
VATLIAAVIEDSERLLAPARILAFRASVFVGDRFMRQAREAREPYLSARVIRGELAGTSSILRVPAIRRASASEVLNVLILHYGEKPRLGPDVQRLVRFRMLEAFIAAHRGYRIKEIVQEFWDEVEPEWVVNGWGRVRNDYADWLRKSGVAAPPAGRRPYLIGVTREEALAVPGSPTPCSCTRLRTSASRPRSSGCSARRSAGRPMPSWRVACGWPPRR